MDLIRREYDVPARKSPEDLVAWLRAFHQRLAAALHNGEAVLDLVPE